jgi:hypothetical protein
MVQGSTFLPTEPNRYRDRVRSPGQYAESVLTLVDGGKKWLFTYSLALPVPI